jgi:glycosyltransferase involved in cell wall biosynthesis
MVSPVPKVSVIIAARNEERHIERCLRSILDGTLPPEDVEIIVAEGHSADRTREIVERIARDHPNVRVIDNPEQIAPTGFNRAIRASRGDAVLIGSAHCCLDPNYLEVCLRKLAETSADATGGREVAVPWDDSLQARLAAAVLGSRFGVGAAYRTAAKEGPVDTVGPALYRRGVFERVGLYDERLVRNQDNEFNSRLRAAGGEIWMTPEAKVSYYGRPGIRRLLAQNYRNGYYAMLNWRITPASFSLRHAIPLLFVVGLLAGAVLAVLEWYLEWFYLAVLGVYGVAAGVSAAQLAIRHRSPALLLVFLLFPILHIAYGIGTLVGIFRFGFTRLPEKVSAKLEPRGTPC